MNKTKGFLMLLAIWALFAVFAVFYCMGLFLVVLVDAVRSLLPKKR